MKGLFCLIPEVPVGLCWISLKVTALVASVTSHISTPGTNSKVEAAHLTVLRGSLCLFPQGEACVLLFRGFCEV